MYQTSTGQLFAFGVLVAMIVAAVVVYQVLSNDVREHLPEYATLKAMGYSFRRLAVVVVGQSIIYMLISYAIAVILGLIVYRVTEELAGIPMRMTYSRPAAHARPGDRRGFLSGSCRSPGCGRPSRRSSSEPNAGLEARLIVQRRNPIRCFPERSSPWPGET